MSIRNLVENKANLDYQALTSSLISEFGIDDAVNWDAVIPAVEQKKLFGGETLRMFEDHPNFSNQKDIRTIFLKKGNTSQLLVLFARLKDNNLSKAKIERITKKFIGGLDAERYVVWFFGNAQNTEFKVVLSGREGKKMVLKSLPFAVNQPYYKTYDFILGEVNKKVAQLFVEPNELWEALWSAFDISVVNKQFYIAIKNSFDDLVGNMLSKSFIESSEIKKHFSIRLIGRIIFCWFLKKKKIINDEVLSSKAVEQNPDYYRVILEKLFFDVFNTPKEYRKQNLPSNIADYPFLNGGLFEAQDDDYRGNYQIYLPNEWFYNLFKNTLEIYNFTIDENSSTNEELAIDPEMLGRIFENLLAEQNPETKIAATERKVTGSYYTPREIVDFMVEQSISEYLKAVLESIIEQAEIEDFVQLIGVSDNIKSHSKIIYEKLNSIKVLDPACGSGAFAIGMMQRLLALKYVILNETDHVEPFDDHYNLKLNTIRNSIFGSDIQPIATELSRLRCWLSLMVEENEKDVQPLPNLNFKFITANSLVELGFEKMISQMETNRRGGMLFLGKFMELKEKISELTRQYFHPSTESHLKADIHQKFNKLQKELAAETISLVPYYPDLASYATKFLDWNPFSDNSVSPFFESNLMFGVTQFDIIIGNPPYIKEYTNKAAFEGLRDSPYYQGKMDLWYFFTCRFIDHLKPHTGILTFIATNNWVTNAGASKFRNKVLEDTQILKMLDFNSYMIFASASIQTMIFILKKDNDQVSYKFDFRKMIGDNLKFNSVLDLINRRNNSSCEYLNPTIDRLSLYNKFLLFGSSELEDILSIIKSKSNFLLDARKEVRQGIVAPQESLNKANQKELGEEYQEGEGIFVLSNKELEKLKLTDCEYYLIKPFYTTKQLVRYYGKPGNEHWLIYTDSSFRDINTIKSFPNIQVHLDRFAPIITSDNKPYGLHRSRNENFFKDAKIISQRKCIRPTFTYTDFDCYVSQTFYVIKTDQISLKYLTCILNSSIVAFWLKNKGKMQGSNFQVDKDPLAEIPIRKIKNTKPFEILVDYIIHLGVNSDDEEKQLMMNYFDNILDGMVYEVYFEEDLKVSDKDFIKHLASLSELGHDRHLNEMLVKESFRKLYANDNHVRKNLYYLDSIESVKKIKKNF